MPKRAGNAKVTIQGIRLKPSSKILQFIARNVTLSNKQELVILE